MHMHANKHETKSSCLVFCYYATWNSVSCACFVHFSRNYYFDDKKQLVLVNVLCPPYSTPIMLIYSLTLKNLRKLCGLLGWSYVNIWVHGFSFLPAEYTVAPKLLPTNQKNALLSLMVILIGSIFKWVIKSYF